MREIFGAVSIGLKLVCFLLFLHMKGGCKRGCYVDMGVWRGGKTYEEEPFGEEALEGREVGEEVESHFWGGWNELGGRVVGVRLLGDRKTLAGVGRVGSVRRTWRGGYLLVGCLGASFVVRRKGEKWMC